jgi:creatinine amidohydrolase/Fe(II)-dependent formamide hydrolase-like protein
MLHLSSRFTRIVPGLLFALATRAAVVQAQPRGAVRQQAPRTARAPRSLFLSDLTSPELQAAVAQGYTTALIYAGSTEGSGPHLALGKHNLRAPHYAERIARGLGQTLVGHVVPFGVNAEPLAGYPGTIAIRPEVLGALHEDIVRSLARAGFRRIVLLNEHGYNVDVLQALAPKLDAELGPRGTRVLYAGANYEAATAEIEAWGRANGVFSGGHGGLWDTSELLLVEPRHVRRTLIALGDTAQTLPAATQQVNGDPRRSSVAMGRKFADIRIRLGVAEIRQKLDSLR